MNRLVTALTIGVGLCALAGCAKPFQYVVVHNSSESVQGKLDGQWFVRTISGESGGLADIELVYCPTLPEVPTVCRTSIVWQDGKNMLYDLASGAPGGVRIGPDGRPLPDPAGPPAAAPVPATP